MLKRVGPAGSDAKELMQLALADVSLLLRENFAHGEHGLVALELTFDQPDLPLPV